MRIALLTPAASPSLSGNAISARRITQALQDAGDEVELVNCSNLRTSEELRARIESARPDLIHVLHAWKSGQFLTGLAADPQARARMGAANRTVAADRADWELNFDRLFGAYDRLAAGSVA